MINPPLGPLYKWGITFFGLFQDYGLRPMELRGGRAQLLLILKEIVLQPHLFVLLMKWKGEAG